MKHGATPRMGSDEATDSKEKTSQLRTDSVMGIQPIPQGAAPINPKCKGGLTVF